MYVDPRRRGLGQMRVTAYTVGASKNGGANPCDDTLYRMTHREACGRLDAAQGPSGTKLPPAPPPAPPPPVPTIVEPILIGGPTEGDPPSAPLPTTYTPTLPLVPGYPAGPYYEPPASGAGDVIVDVQAPGTELALPEPAERGFGLLEAAVGAGLAFLIAQAWQDRGKRRR